MVTNNPTNSNSVGALSLGVLSILIPLLGLVLGIIGIIFSKKAKKEIALTSENGMGLATAGLVCSIVGVIVQTFIILNIALFTTITTANIV